MTKDFAKTSRNHQNGDRKPKERNQRVTQTNSAADNSTAFKPFLAGSVFGVALCLSVQWFLAQRPATEPPLADTEQTNTEAITGPVFDFYTKLREVEVMVPDQGPEEETQDLIYLLQAGSFRDATDADSMRAQLILLNLSAEIRKFNHNGEIWHRVIVGPYETRSTMSKDKTILLENGIEALLLTQAVQE